MVTSASATACNLLRVRLSGSCTAATEEAAAECWLTAQRSAPRCQGQQHQDARQPPTRWPGSAREAPLSGGRRTRRRVVRGATSRSRDLLAGQGGTARAAAGSSPGSRTPGITV